MAYEHKKEVDIAASSLVKMLELAIDNVQDETQIAQFLAASMGAFAAIQPAIASETKNLFKAKIFVFLGLSVVQEGLVLVALEVSDKTLQIVNASVAYLRRLISILLPDSES